MINLSVIVCCYNSQYVIKDTLEYLANQQTNNAFNYEVVLVDNNCTDYTVEVANAVWNELDTPIDLNVVTESKPGLSYAREAGVKHSKGEFIVFCDDDNWLASDYLQIAFNFMMKHPEVGALGGQSIGVLEGVEPKWWHKEAKNYAVGKQAAKSGDVSSRGYVWGAGMVFRKSLFLRLYNTGFESLLSDRKGELLSSGGDSELCKWFILMGYKLWYLETLKFNHYIIKSRLLDTYLVKLKAGHESSSRVLGLYNWFINNHLFSSKRNKLNRFFIFITKSIKAKRQKSVISKLYLQLAFEDFIKINASLYHITKIYKKLKKY